MKKINVFKEHLNVIWGTKCKCGYETYILQNKFHPWNETDFVAHVICPKCNRTNEIDKKLAEEFYDNKILSYFDDVEGIVIDAGCGGGYLSSYLVNKDKVKRIYTIDIDLESKEWIDKINDNKISFHLMDVEDLEVKFGPNSVDYIVNRDVFMFIEDISKYFDSITKIARKGIRQMGWFVLDNERMKNKLSPIEIVGELEKRGWKVELEVLDWYKSGYFIMADKVI